MYDLIAPDDFSVVDIKIPMIKMSSLTQEKPENEGAYASHIGFNVAHNKNIKFQLSLPKNYKFIVNNEEVSMLSYTQLYKGDEQSKNLGVKIKNTKTSKTYDFNLHFNKNPALVTVAEPTTLKFSRLRD